jgi:hypothetical protein
MSDFAQISSLSIEGSGCISPDTDKAVQKAEQNSVRIMPQVNADLKSDGWQMFNDNEEDCGIDEVDDDDNWISLTIKSVDSIKKQEKASVESFNRKSLNEKISELCDPTDDAGESAPEQAGIPRSNATSVKRSRGSRPFILVLLDPFVRARAPLAILILIGFVLAASLYQAMTFAPQENSGQKTTTAPMPPVAHVFRAPHVQRRAAIHYQHAAVPANAMEPEVTVTVPAAAEYGHRHAYQTYR